MVAGTRAVRPPATTAIRRYLRRIVTRPRAWLLGYLLTLLPAALLALLTALPGLPLARYPLLRRMLETRALDLLPDLATLDVENSLTTPLGMLALLLVPLAWIAIRLLWVTLEGSTLADYAATTRPTWRAFVRAGWHWLGPLLLINVTGSALVLVVEALTLLLAALAYAVFPPLGWGVGGLGLLLAGLLATWTEVARATAVVHNERHAFRALRRAARVMLRQAGPLLALAGGGLALYGALYLTHRWAIRRLPIPWWLATLAVQQIYVLARMGVRLARQAAEIGLLAPPPETEDSGL